MRTQSIQTVESDANMWLERANRAFKWTCVSAGATALDSVLFVASIPEDIPTGLKVLAGAGAVVGSVFTAGNAIRSVSASVAASARNAVLLSQSIQEANYIGAGKPIS